MTMAAHSSPCTLGIGGVGWIGGAGLASAIGGAAPGVSGGFACTAADCCGGCAGFSPSGLSSALRQGGGFGIGTAGKRLASFGIEAGGRGGSIKSPKACGRPGGA